ncbi:amino acid/polyamine transporter I [Aspergillus pseudodeflectus]|uniref:Amino acid/polyamine transporter I n=1 Tax=Aspergillus pseudodeflectus TaxID=176178 RepID=A0ABR4JTS5_9EURO
MQPFPARDPTLSDDVHEVLLPSHSHDNDAADQPLPRRHLGLVSTIFLITNRMIGTAIFSTPSAIAGSVGSAGAALALWIVGLALSYCGLSIWIELGSLMPRSGGEKVYLEAAYPHPQMLITTIFAVHVIFLGFTGIGSVVVAENILLALHGSASDWVKRVIAIAVLAVIATIHIRSRTMGVRIMNVLASVKILILFLIIISGLRALRGDLPRIPDPASSFRSPFAGSSTEISHYTNALFKILATYQGWSNAAYVLDEVQNPRRVLKIAGLLGVGTVGLLYTLANIAYFIVATPEEISKTGVTVVALLIGKVFGDTMLWLTAILAALSSFGNLMTASFSMSRVVREFAKEGLVPYAPFFAATTSSGSPSGAFLLVFLSPILMILFIPFGEVYNFLLDVGQYAVAIINILVVIGLFIIRRKTAHQRTFRAWTPVVCLFLATQVYLLVTPFVSAGVVEEKSLPSWLYAAMAILVLSGAGSYWLLSWVVIPHHGRFVWRARKSLLSDGSSMVSWDKVKVS